MFKYANCIGGYGELELPYLNDGLHQQAIAVQSARAALYLFLKEKKVGVLFLPDYICDSLYPAIKFLDIEVKTYSIDETLSIPQNITLGQNEFILVVNYFGICRAKIDDFFISTKIAPEQVIIDNSQALFEPHQKCGASIYSPRKFLGVADGGFLYTEHNVPSPNEAYEAESWLTHLLLRSCDDVQTGYQHFLDAENALSDFIPKKMSEISQRLIKSNDFAAIKLKRIENFAKLHAEFQDINQFSHIPNRDEVPLCYPLKLEEDVSTICLQLVAFNIFLPRYWPKLDTGQHANDWYDKTLFLPVDHRIDKTKIDFLILKVRELL